MKAIFLAAGDSTRIRDNIEEKSKCLINIEGSSLLYTSIVKLVNRISVNEIVIVVGESGDDIRNVIGDTIGNTKVSYFKQEKKNGVLGAINTIIEYVNDDVVIQLGDEYYEEPKYYEIKEVFETSDCVFGVVEASDEQIKNNYSVTFSNGKLVSFIEKPTEIVNNFAGTGLMMIKKNLLECIHSIYENENKYDMVDFFNKCVETGKCIREFIITDFYININTINDYERLIKHLDENAKKYYFDEYYELYLLHRSDIKIVPFYQGKFAEVYEAMCNINGDNVTSEQDDTVFFEENDIYKRYLAECRGNSVLELACGSGRISARLACERIYVTGVDNSQMMLEILNYKMHTKHKKFCKYLNVINDDITTLTRVNDEFDIVILPATTIRLLEVNLSRFLNHIYKYIKDGGFFIFDIIEPKTEPDEDQVNNKYSMTYDIDYVKNIMFFEERHDFNIGKTQVNFYLNSFEDEIKHYLSYTYLNLIDRKRVINAVKETDFNDVIFEEYADDNDKKMFFCVLKK